MDLSVIISSINTVKDLQKALSTILEPSKEVDDEQIIWLNALWYTQCLSENASLKDMASALLEGVNINSLEAVQEELDLMKEDGEEEYFIALVYYISSIAKCYRKYDKAEEILKLID